MNATTPYQSFTPLMAFNLASPHTWPASILPVLLAFACASSLHKPLSVVMFFVLLAISILMQTATNILNDYCDFKKGLDSKEDTLEESDAVLVYNNINPKAVLALAVSCLVLAFLLGLYVIYQAGFIPLIIGVIGALCVVFYSVGKKSISSLPLGELVSGFVMGGLIMLASYQALTLQLDYRVLIWAFPSILGIGLIMMTNNTCDIEKDGASGRKTLPSLLGRPRTLIFYRTLVMLWLLGMALIVGVYFTNGLALIPFAFLASFPLLKALLANPLQQKTRIAAMSQIVSTNIALGGFYAAAILCSQVSLVLL